MYFSIVINMASTVDMEELREGVEAQALFCQPHPDDPSGRFYKCHIDGRGTQREKKTITVPTDKIQSPHGTDDSQWLATNMGHGSVVGVNNFNVYSHEKPQIRVKAGWIGHNDEMGDFCVLEVEDIEG